MTIHEYLNYPMGRNSAIFMVKDAKDKMIERFLLVEDEIKMVIYDTGSSLVFHMELPSESSKGLSYDVVIEVLYTKMDENRGNNIFEFPFNVYSNCPSFIYNYAYVFYQKKLICKWLLNRYDKKTLTLPPKKRNEYGIIFYEKSIFFAVYFIWKNLNMSVDALKGKAIKASIGAIKGKITSQNDISANRNMIKDIEKQEKEGKIPKQSVSKRKKILEEDQKKNSSTRGIRKPKGAKQAKGPKKPKGHHDVNNVASSSGSI